MQKMGSQKKDFRARVEKLVWEKGHDEALIRKSKVSNTCNGTPFDGVCVGPVLQELESTCHDTLYKILKHLDQVLHWENERAI